MDMMRSACAPKFPKLTVDDLNGLRAGNNMEAENKDLKCYTACIAQMTGTVIIAYADGSLTFKTLLTFCESIV